MKQDSQKTCDVWFVVSLNKLFMITRLLMIQHSQHSCDITAMKCLSKTPEKHFHMLTIFVLCKGVWYGITPNLKYFAIKLLSALCILMASVNFKILCFLQISTTDPIWSMWVQHRLEYTLYFWKLQHYSDWGTTYFKLKLTSTMPW